VVAVSFKGNREVLVDKVEKEYIKNYAIAEALSSTHAGVVAGKLKDSNNIEKADLKGSAKMVHEAVEIAMKGANKGVTR
jgi:hypothetical protein